MDGYDHLNKRLDIIQRKYNIPFSFNTESLQKYKDSVDPIEFLNQTKKVRNILRYKELTNEEKALITSDLFKGILSNRHNNENIILRFIEGADITERIAEELILLKDVNLMLFVIELTDFKITTNLLYLTFEKKNLEMFDLLSQFIHVDDLHSNLYESLITLNNIDFFNVLMRNIFFRLSNGVKHYLFDIVKKYGNVNALNTLLFYDSSHVNYPDDFLWNEYKTSKGSFKSYLNTYLFLFDVSILEETVSPLFHKFIEIDRKLILASKINQSDEIEKLLSQGGDPNAMDEDGFSVLSYVISNNNVEICKLLIEKHVDLHVKVFGAHEFLDELIKTNRLSELNIHPQIKKDLENYSNTSEPVQFKKRFNKNEFFYKLLKEVEKHTGYSYKFLNNLSNDLEFLFAAMVNYRAFKKKWDINPMYFRKLLNNLSFKDLEKYWNHSLFKKPYIIKNVLNFFKEIEMQEISLQFIVLNKNIPTLNSSINSFIIDYMQSLGDISYVLSLPFLEAMLMEDKYDYQSVEQMMKDLDNMYKKAEQIIKHMDKTNVIKLTTYFEELYKRNEMIFISVLKKLESFF